MAYLQTPHTHSINAAPGTEQHFALSLSHTSRLGLPYSKHCSSDQTYSKEQCMHNCVDEHVWSRCGCDFFAHNLSRPNCTIEQFMKCSGKAYKELYMSDIQADGDVCNCSLPCEENTYTAQVTNLKYPSDAKAQSISAKKGKSKEYLQNNIIEVYLYFQSFSVQKIREVPSYSLADLAADVGGQMGLFVGASIISLSEFLELLLDLLMGKLCTCNRSKKIATAALQK